jgi:hypothetical protein
VRLPRNICDAWRYYFIAWAFIIIRIGVVACMSAYMDVYRLRRLHREEIPEKAPGSLQLDMKGVPYAGKRLTVFSSKGGC